MITLWRFFLIYPTLLGLITAFGVAAVRISLRPRDRRDDWFLAAAALTLPVEIGCQFIATSLSRIRPLKYDLYVWRFDELLGQPAFVIGRWTSGPVWHAILSVAYGALPLVMLAVFAGYLWRVSEWESWRVIRTFLVAAVGALPIYLLFPVSGPAFAFPHFPQSGAPDWIHPIAIAAAPNGVPSVHFASALLVWYFTRRWRIGSFLAALYVALMAAATMGSGQHYAFDLITAVPYTWLVILTLRHATQDETRTAAYRHGSH